MSDYLSYLLVKYCLSSFQRQMHMNELIGKSSGWNVDIDRETLSFGNYHWHAEILGTESYATRMWIWAWANSISNLPSAMIQSSLIMKRLGERHNVRELIEPQIHLNDELNGYIFPLIASGVCNANAYYRCPYADGTAYLLINDDHFPHDNGSPLSRLAVLLPHAISNLNIPNHRLALLMYLEQCGIAYQTRNNVVIVSELCKTTIACKFDKRGRLKKIERGVQQP